MKYVNIQTNVGPVIACTTNPENSCETALLQLAPFVPRSAVTHCRAAFYR